MKVSSSNSYMLGFGEHCNPTSHSAYKTAKMIYEIAVALLVTGVIGSIAVVTGAVLNVGLSISAPIAIGLAASSSVFTLGAISSVVYYRICQSSYFGLLDKLIAEIRQPTALGEFEKIDVIPCEDTIESFEWKKKLIEAANHNIIISGNYCGGKSFDDILDLIDRQLDRKTGLKAIVLSSDVWINSDNRKRIESLHQRYQDRFQLIETPVIFHINPGLKKSSNHVKALAIDYGKYFVLGGSGIEDKYAFAKGLGDNQQLVQKTDGLLGWIMPRGFRDQDFIFHSPKSRGIGKRVYIENLKLALRWQALNKLIHFDPKLDLAEEFETTDDVVRNLLKEESKKEHEKLIQVKTYIQEFHQSKKCVTKTPTKIFCSGPEHDINQFEKEIICRIKKAKTRIIVDHMFFHPSTGVMNALIDAANRGVKIKIITNGYHLNKSPKGHQYFGPRSRWNYCWLKNHVHPEAKKNIDVYEFKVKKTTLHKKIIVADDYVISGSSNLGYKSLVTMSDHEINFVTKSKNLANQVASITEVDSQVDPKDAFGHPIIDEEKKVVKGYARKINTFNPDFSTCLIAIHHRMMAPSIG